MIILLQAPIQNKVVSGLLNRDPAQGGSILGKFFSSLVGLLLVLAAIWAFANLLLGAFSWISSGGDKGKVEAAQQRITQAIIGLFLVFASWAIFVVLLRFLGISGVEGLKLPTLF